MVDGRSAGAVLSVIIRTVAETGSTNADMIALAATDVAEGIWLRAEIQTSGRGRYARAWASPAGNLYASTLVRLRRADPIASSLALVAAVALDEVVRAWLPAGASVQLKWPNDLLLDGAKLSGILLERSDAVVVVGIGVNLAHHPDLPDRRTTCMAAHGVAPDPAAFAQDLGEAFARWLGRWRSEGLEPLRQRWLQHAHRIGTALTITLPDGETVSGLFDGLDGDGALLLRLASGERRTIHAGDVFLV